MSAKLYWDCSGGVWSFINLHSMSVFQLPLAIKFLSYLILVQVLFGDGGDNVPLPSAVLIAATPPASVLLLQQHVLIDWKKAYNVKEYNIYPLLQKEMEWINHDINTP